MTTVRHRTHIRMATLPGRRRGHKTLAMLKRYTHLHAEDLAKRLG
jgi:hypothetical protein